MNTCKKICRECPFSKTSAKGWLGHHTIDEIMHTMQMEGLFSCHMQRTDESTIEDIMYGDIDVCRGFLASASASAKLFGQNPAYGSQLLELQKQITNDEKTGVLKRWEFVEHHTL